MFKTLNHIDEVEEAHKKDGYISDKNEKKVNEKKMEDSKKSINAKYIFDKTPKNNVNKNKRKPRDMTKSTSLPLIKEFGY